MRIITLLLISIFYGIIAQAQVQVIYPKNQGVQNLETPIRSVQDEGTEGLEVSYSFSQIISSTNMQKGKNYQMLSIVDFSHLQEVGLPALPAHIDLVAIPEGANYQLIITDDVPSVFNTATVHPALEPARDTEGAPEPKFEINEDFYNTDQIYPAQTVEIIGFMQFRGVRMAMVQVCPVQYNPATNKLFVHEEVNYEISFTGASKFTNYQEHTENYIKQLLNYPLNATSWQKEAKHYYSNPLTNIQSTSIGSDYIIITHSNFQAAADSLAQWKRQMGYKVEVVSASNWNAQSIKTAVHTRYANWNPKPDYLLIIGDHNQVPAEIFYTPSYNDPFGTDLYYVCMNGNGDYVPDMAKGRISTTTAADAMMQVQKIISYERNPITDTNFYQNGLNCAQYQDDNTDGYADRRFCHTSENIRDYVMAKGYNSQRIYYTANNVTPINYNNGYYSTGQAIPSVLLKSNGFNWNGGSTDIKNAINAGKFFVFHRDHGYSGGYGWAHPYYVNSKVAQLSNGNKLPVIFSINCHTGEFTLPSCLAETFMRKSGGGAVGVVAASYYSYSGNNDGFSLGMIDAIWSNPGLLPAFGTGGVSYPNTTPHNDIVKMGDVVNHGLVRMVQTWGGGSSSNKYTHQLFHYFGDPSMRMWTSSPETISAVFADTVSCMDTAFMISNCSDSNAVATIMGNGVLLGRTTLSNGNGHITLTGLQGSYLTLTITGRDQRPLIQTLAIGGGSVLSSFYSAVGNKCFGDSLGEIEVFPACGVPPYQVLWSTSDTTNKIQNLASGSYSVIITDGSSAVVYDTLVVDGPASALQANAIVTNAKCYFESSGKIELQTIGGAAPYAYQWSSGGSGAINNNIAAGGYQVSITDSLGCQIVKSYTITQPQPLDMTTSFTDDILNNCTGTATSVPSGGTTPYTFLWNDPASQSTAIAVNLCKGLYKITLKDSNDCISYRTIFISNTVGVNSVEENNWVNIFPNPSNDGVFNIEMTNINNSNYQLRLYNSIGELLIDKTIKPTINQTETINLSSYASGIYYLQVQNEDGEAKVFKLIFE